MEQKPLGQSEQDFVLDFGTPAKGIVAPSNLSRRMMLSAVPVMGGAAAMGLGAIAAHGQDRVPVDLTNFRDLLSSFVKTVGDLSGDQVCLWAHGSIYAWLPRMGGVHLMDEDLFAVRRFQKIENGWLRLHKEAGIYLDKDTGEIMDEWHNPLIGRKVDVIHLKNDPVNREHVPVQQGGFWGTHYWEMQDLVCFYRNVLITREADMQPEDYPLHAQDDQHKFAELYNFFANREDLENPQLTSAPMKGCNTRVGNWLPWMEMGQRSGHLLIQLRFKKLKSVEDLPRKTLDYFEKNAPEFLEAPTEVTGPNETSWSYFKKIIDERRAERAGSM